MNTETQNQKDVDEIGVVINSKQPSINGYGCWALEEYRGKKVRICGIAKKTVITEDMDADMKKGGVAHKGPGVYWNIEIVKHITVVE